MMRTAADSERSGRAVIVLLLSTALLLAALPAHADTARERGERKVRTDIESPLTGTAETEQPGYRRNAYASIGGGDPFSTWVTPYYGTFQTAKCYNNGLVEIEISGGNQGNIAALYWYRRWNGNDQQWEAWKYVGWGWVRGNPPVSFERHSFSVTTGYWYDVYIKLWHPRAGYFYEGRPKFYLNFLGWTGDYSSAAENQSFCAAF